MNKHHGVRGIGKSSQSDHGSSVKLQLHELPGGKILLCKGPNQEQPTFPSQGSWCPQRDVTYLILCSVVLI